MYVILVYDVGQKRVGKIHKICKKYLFPVQRSVFEGYISIAQLNKLKRELTSGIHTEEDAVRIYKMDNTKYVAKEEIGIVVEEKENMI